MKWKLKAHSLAVLSRVPGGRFLYHRLQSLLGTNRLNAAESVQRASEVIELITATGQSPRDATVLEIGTGWRPFLPLLLSLSGAKRIVTLDINPWLTKTYAIETFRALSAQLPAVVERLGLDPEEVRARYAAVGQSTGSLEALLSAARIEYRCPGDATRTGFPDGTVDFVCSSNVLEHVYPEVIRRIHAESLRVLRPRGLAVHRVNPGDHYAGVDRSITVSNFLRYSEREWRWYGGSGLSYHNRLRCARHGQLLREAGFHLLTERVRIDPRAVEAVRSGVLPVHPDFAGHSPEELAADYVWLTGEKPIP